MDWPVLIEVVKKALHEIDIGICPPASDALIGDAEKKLGVTFPPELIKYLEFSNGILEYINNPKKHESISIGYLVWPVNKIVSELLAHADFINDPNRSMKVVFFSDNGCGESFGYIMNNDENYTDIYVYYPIENDYKRVASGLEEWLIDWCSGKIRT